MALMGDNMEIILTKQTTFATGHGQTYENHTSQPASSSSKINSRQGPKTHAQFNLSKQHQNRTKQDNNPQVVVKAQEFEASKVAHAFQIPPLEQMAKVREASKFSKGEMSISERMPKKDDRS